MTRLNSCIFFGSLFLLQKPLFLSRTVLTGLADAKWTAEHDAILEHFAQDPSEAILTIFIDPCLGLKLEMGMPVQVGTLLSQVPRWSSRELRVPRISVISAQVLLPQRGMKQAFAFDDLVV